MTRSANLLPQTLQDNPRCRPYCLENGTLLLSDDMVEDAWIACQTPPTLRYWC